MCGIAGSVGLRLNEQDIEKMLHSMGRRGPDDNGHFGRDGCCLLHSRLSIIDPSGGKQPMTLRYNGEDYTIVYNGELYNTEEIRDILRRLGHRFLGHSDTEVVLHAYAQWSEACLEKFNGIFAFGVWEHKRKKLFLARDRIGVKPLFYSLKPEGIVFASEIKTILASGHVVPRLGHTGVVQLLMLGPGRVPGSGVMENIFELEPGCFGCFYGGKWSWKRYWKLCDREHTDSFAQTADRVRFLVKDAIVRQMVSDVPIGTFLSGGLDSSLISSVCAERKKQDGECLMTFSVDYENNEKFFVPGKFQPNSDNMFIEIMRDYLQAEHHWTVIGAKELFSALECAVEARDIPGMADVDASLLLFCADIKKRVKVALSGECADEIFGGYPWYRDPDIRKQAGFPWAQNTKEREVFLHPEFRKYNGTEFVMDMYTDTINNCDILPGTSRLERRMKEMVNLNHRWFMQTLLDRKDRMSMYSGLEVRVPFCDYRIAEYLYAVPWEMKEYQGKEKGLLRYAMSDYLPDDVLYRKKSPYPKTYDPAYMDLVSKALREIVDDENAPIHQIVDSAALRHLLSTEYPWPWYGQLMRTPQTIAYMIQLNHWMKTYGVIVE